MIFLISGMIADLKNAPPYSIIIFHACAHNPTGVDPKQEEWKMLAEVCLVATSCELNPKLRAT